MEALYVALPGFFPDGFATHQDDDREVAMVWLVPIARFEVEFVRSYGWKRFEDELAKAKPDLIDMRREPLFG